MQKLKAAILDFFNTLSIYDYVGFFLTLFLFFLFMILALLLRRRTILAMSLVILSFVFFFGGPVMAHLLVKNSVFKSYAEITEVKQLYYSDTLILRGMLHYQGKKNANHCEVDVALHKKGPNIVKDFVYSLKAYRKGSKRIDKVFEPGESMDFKIVIEPFNYKGDYNISVASGCYK